MPQPVPRSLFLRHVQGKRGANERTRTAYLTTLRVIYQALQGSFDTTTSRGSLFIFDGPTGALLAIPLTVAVKRLASLGEPKRVIETPASA